MSLPDCYRWNEERKKLLFFGNDSILLSKSPALATFLGPLIEQLGEGFYFILVAYEASKGEQTNYEFIISQKAGDFEYGFAESAKFVSNMGWGHMSLKSIDWDNKKATIDIQDPWELSIRQAKNISDNLPVMCGKASGLFTLAMNSNMRALVTSIKELDGYQVATIEINQSDTTLKSELEELNRREGHNRYEQLQILKKQLKETKNELEHANRQLVDLTIKDELTGVHNRRYFMGQASQHHCYQQRYHRAASVLILDIDHFRNINDTFGHKAGDLALIEFAQSCQNNFRDTDIFARLGGEEFAVSMPGLNLQQACKAAEKTRKLVEKLRINYEEQVIKFTVSIGVVEMMPAESLEDAINRADKALYVAKSISRNIVIPG